MVALIVVGVLIVAVWIGASVASRRRDEGEGEGEGTERAGTDNVRSAPAAQHQPRERRSREERARASRDLGAAVIAAGVFAVVLVVVVGEVRKAQDAPATAASTEPLTEPDTPPSLPDAAGPPDSGEYRRAETACPSQAGRYRLNLAIERHEAAAMLFRDRELLRRTTAPPRAVVSSAPFDLPAGCYRLATVRDASAWLTRRTTAPPEAAEPEPKTAVHIVSKVPDQWVHVVSEGDSLEFCLSRAGGAEYEMEVAATGTARQQPEPVNATLTRVDGERVQRLPAGGVAHEKLVSAATC